MSKYVFPYGIRFQEDGKIDVFPAAEIIVAGKHGSGLRALFHLDSGATTSILPTSDGKVLGISVESGTKILARGFSGELVNGFKHKISISFNDFKIRIPAIFVNNESVPRILGREGIFEKFAIFFDEPKRRTGFFDSRKARKSIDTVFE